MITYGHEIPVKEYNSIRESVGWKVLRKQALIEDTKNTGNSSMKFKEYYKKDESILGM